MLMAVVRLEVYNVSHPADRTEYVLHLRANRKDIDQDVAALLNDMQAQWAYWMAGKMISGGHMI